MRPGTLSALVLVSTACVPQATHVAPPAPAQVAIDAPMEVVARAVRAELTDRAIDVDRGNATSHVIATHATPQQYGDGLPALVDCGASGQGHGYAVYRVRLTSDGARTLVRPELSFNRRTMGGPLGHVPPEGALGRCPSRQVWETRLVSALQARVAGRPHSFVMYLDGSTGQLAAGPASSPAVVASVPPR